MRIGIVCPYSFDRPGGVQLHIMDLAEILMERGHEVSVIAPGSPDTAVPDYVSIAGKSIPVHYNGSVARVKFGPIAAARVRIWLRDGNFDVVHLHEPGTMSLSVIAMWARLGPTVATFHTSNDHSRMMRIAKPFIKPGYEELDARIAVSPSADRTVKEHLGVAATHIIPNGVDTEEYVVAEPRGEWTGTRRADHRHPGQDGRAAQGTRGVPRRHPACARPLPACPIPGRRPLLRPRCRASGARGRRGGRRTRRGHEGTLHGVGRRVLRAQHRRREPSASSWSRRWRRALP
nr:glycosyltransferase family 4 protein [Demequina litorisediminis]